MKIFGILLLFVALIGSAASFETVYVLEGYSSIRKVSRPTPRLLQEEETLQETNLDASLLSEKTVTPLDNSLKDFISDEDDTQSTDISEKNRTDTKTETITTMPTIDDEKKSKGQDDLIEVQSLLEASSKEKVSLEKTSKFDETSETIERDFQNDSANLNKEKSSLNLEENRNVLTNDNPHETKTLTNDIKITTEDPLSKSFTEMKENSKFMNEDIPDTTETNIETTKFIDTISENDMKTKEIEHETVNIKVSDSTTEHIQIFEENLETTSPATDELTGLVVEHDIMDAEQDKGSELKKDGSTKKELDSKISRSDVNMSIQQDGLTEMIEEDMKLQLNSNRQMPITDGNLNVQEIGLTKMVDDDVELDFNAEIPITVAVMNENQEGSTKVMKEENVNLVVDFNTEMPSTVAAMNENQESSTKVMKEENVNLVVDFNTEMPSTVAAMNENQESSTKVMKEKNVNLDLDFNTEMPSTVAAMNENQEVSTKVMKENVNLDLDFNTEMPSTVAAMNENQEVSTKVMKENVNLDLDFNTEMPSTVAAMNEEDMDGTKVMKDENINLVVDFTTELPNPVEVMNEQEEGITKVLNNEDVRLEVDFNTETPSTFETLNTKQEDMTKMINEKTMNLDIDFNTEKTKLDSGMTVEQKGMSKMINHEEVNLEQNFNIEIPKLHSDMNTEQEGITKVIRDENMTVELDLNTEIPSLVESMNKEQEGMTEVMKDENMTVELDSNTEIPSLVESMNEKLEVITKVSNDENIKLEQDLNAEIPKLDDAMNVAKENTTEMINEEDVNLELDFITEIPNIIAAMNENGESLTKILEKEDVNSGIDFNTEIPSPTETLNLKQDGIMDMDIDFNTESPIIDSAIIVEQEGTSKMINHEHANLDLDFNTEIPKLVQDGMSKMIIDEDANLEQDFNTEIPILHSAINEEQEVMNKMLNDDEVNLEPDFNTERPFTIEVMNEKQEVMNKMLNDDEVILEPDFNTERPFTIEVMNEKQEGMNKMLNDDEVNLELDFNTERPFTIEVKNEEQEVMNKMLNDDEVILEPDFNTERPFTIEVKNEEQEGMDKMLNDDEVILEPDFNTERPFTIEVMNEGQEGIVNIMIDENMKLEPDFNTEIPILFDAMNVDQENVTEIINLELDFNTEMPITIEDMNEEQEGMTETITNENMNSDLDVNTEIPTLVEVMNKEQEGMVNLMIDENTKLELDFNTEIPFLIETMNENQQEGMTEMEMINDEDVNVELDFNTELPNTDVVMIVEEENTTEIINDEELNLELDFNTEIPNTVAAINEDIEDIIKMMKNEDVNLELDFNTEIPSADVVITEELEGMAKMMKDEDENLELDFNTGILRLGDAMNVEQESTTEITNDEVNFELDFNTEMPFTIEAMNEEDQEAMIKIMEGEDMNLQLDFNTEKPKLGEAMNIEQEVNITIMKDVDMKTEIEGDMNVELDSTSEMTITIGDIVIGEDNLDVVTNFTENNEEIEQNYVTEQMEDTTENILDLITDSKIDIIQHAGLNDEAGDLVNNEATEVVNIPNDVQQDPHPEKNLTNEKENVTIANVTFENESGHVINNQLLHQSPLLNERKSVTLQHNIAKTKENNIPGSNSKLDLLKFHLGNADFSTIMNQFRNNDFPNSNSDINSPSQGTPFPIIPQHSFDHHQLNNEQFHPVQFSPQLFRQRIKPSSIPNLKPSRPDNIGQKFRIVPLNNDQRFRITTSPPNHPNLNLENHHRFKFSEQGQPTFLIPNNGALNSGNPDINPLNIRQHHNQGFNVVNHPSGRPLNIRQQHNQDFNILNHPSLLSPNMRIPIEHRNNDQQLLHRAHQSEVPQPHDQIFRIIGPQAAVNVQNFRMPSDHRVSDQENYNEENSTGVPPSHSDIFLPNRSSNFHQSHQGNNDHPKTLHDLHLVKEIMLNISTQEHDSNTKSNKSLNETKNLTNLKLLMEVYPLDSNIENKNVSLNQNLELLNKNGSTSQNLEFLLSELDINTLGSSILNISNNPVNFTTVIVELKNKTSSFNISNQSISPINLEQDSVNPSYINKLVNNSQEINFSKSFTKEQNEPNNFTFPFKPNFDDVDIDSLLSEIDFSSLDLASVTSDQIPNNFSLGDNDITEVISRLNSTGIDVAAIAESYGIADIDFTKIVPKNIDISQILNKIQIPQPKLSTFDSAIKNNSNISIGEGGVNLEQNSNTFPTGLDLGSLISNFDLGSLNLESLIAPQAQRNPNASQNDLVDYITLINSSGVDVNKIDESFGLNSLDLSGIANLDISAILSSDLNVTDTTNSDKDTVTQSLTQTKNSTIDGREKEIIDQLGISSLLTIAKISNFKFSSNSSSTICTICESVIAVVNKLIFEMNKTDSEVKSLAGFVCLDLEIFPKDVCRGLVDNLAEEVIQVLRVTRHRPSTFCGLLFTNQCNRTILPAWELTRNSRDIVKPEPTIPPSGGGDMKILHLSDLHLDLEYEEGTATDCGRPLCCRNWTNQSDNHTNWNEDSNLSRLLANADDPNFDINTNSSMIYPALSGKWGSFGQCDLPLRTIDATLQAAAALKPDLVYITGDLPAHDVWSQTKRSVLDTIRVITDRVMTAFPKTDVVMSIGNHDTSPVNSFPVPEAYSLGFNPKWLYESLAEGWTKWLPEDSKETLLKGGYYSLSPRKGLRVISLNSNYCYALNWWLLVAHEDPTEQLQWLTKELDTAVLENQKVHILTHIPPGNKDCEQNWSRQFASIITRYANTVTGIFSGHQHLDQWQVIHDPEEPLRPVGVVYVTPSVTTFRKHSPSFRIYHVDDLGDRPTYTVVDHSTYTMNLTLANEADGVPVYQERYSAKEAFNMTHLGPKAWSDLTLQMSQDDQLYKNHLRYKHNYWNEPYEVESCTGVCKERVLCYLLTGDSSNHLPCENLKETSLKHESEVL